MTTQELLEQLNKDLSEMPVSEKAHVQRSRIMQAYLQEVQKEDVAEVVEEDNE